MPQSVLDVTTTCVPICRQKTNEAPTAQELRGRESGDLHGPPGSLHSALQRERALQQVGPMPCRANPDHTQVPRRLRWAELTRTGAGEREGPSHQE